MQRMCHLAEVSRAGFYRRRLPAAVPSRGTGAARRRYSGWRWNGPPMAAGGSRRELQQRGWTVNRKRVQRMMREDNLLCLRHRKFVVTTDSNHDLPVYPNLAESMVLTGINQLWRADITYIRLAEEFVYLAVILDAYSRRVIGWALDRTLEDSLTLTALEMALAQRGARAGPGAPFRSRSTVRQPRLHSDLEGTRHPHQHVAHRQSLGQRRLRVVHEDAEVRGSVSQRVPRPGRRLCAHRGVPGGRLQPEAAALGAGLPLAG